MEAVLSTETTAFTTAQRGIALRTAGDTRGAITRLVSPGGAGELIKPFIFLDLFHIGAGRNKMGMHPHSGIATVTVVMNGALEYRETTGSEGVLPAGGIEWMSAGGGVWHDGGPADGAGVEGFQLWLALPPEDENGPAQSQYLAPERVPRRGPARVVIGQYEGATSPIQTRASINYLHVKLADGERWRYVPPSGHDVAWVAPARGALLAAETTIGREIAIFEQGNAPLDFTAQGDTEFVLGSAVKHLHDLVTGYYSVHTNAAALEKGENEIKRIGAQLRSANLM